MAEKETRTRSWTFILYPDSSPSNWRELINEQHIEWCVSPKHDRDFSANGEPKKEHYHVLLLFGGVKSFDQVKEFTDLCNAPIPQRCHSVRAMVRYFCHLDDANKAQYSVKDIEAYGGIDIFELMKPGFSEKYCHISDMMQFIDDNGIFNFSEFVRVVREVSPDVWFPLLCDNCALIISQYIKELRHDEKYLCSQIKKKNKLN